MKDRKTEKLAITTIGAWWLRNIVGPAKAFHLSRAAQRDEHHGLPCTAAMEWRRAAELFAPGTLVSEYCWGQWERIMHLPRRLAGPIGSPPIQHASGSLFDKKPLFERLEPQAA